MSHPCDSPPEGQPPPDNLRSLRGRANAYRLHATHDSRELTQAARAAFEQKFVDEARLIAGPGAPDDEVARRAELLRKAHFTELAIKSAKARRLRAQADELDAEAGPGGDAA